MKANPTVTKRIVVFDYLLSCLCYITDANRAPLKCPNGHAAATVIHLRNHYRTPAEGATLFPTDAHSVSKLKGKASHGS